MGAHTLSTRSESCQARVERTHALRNLVFTTVRRRAPARSANYSGHSDSTRPCLGDRKGRPYGAGVVDRIDKFAIHCSCPKVRPPLRPRASSYAGRTGRVLIVLSLAMVTVPALAPFGLLTFFASVQFTATTPALRALE